MISNFAELLKNYHAARKECLKLSGIPLTKKESHDSSHS